MHKNLVLDMGNVLVTYDPVWVIQEYTDREDWIKEIKDVMFYSGEWIRLDAGLMSEEDALKAWMKRCSSPQVAELCKSCFENWDKFNMKKIPGVAEILKEEKAQGRKLYLLSNASMRLVPIWKEVLPGSEYFDGIFYSAAFHCMKPQDIIYERFLKHFSLEAKDCFFIDDLTENIEGAKKAGLDGAVLPLPQASALRKILEEEKNA